MISWDGSYYVVLLPHSSCEKSGWCILQCFLAERIVENSCGTSENPFQQTVCFFHNCLGHIRIFIG
jgi:hypothetical protein